MELMPTTTVAFADNLLAIGAVKFGAFRLKLHEKKPDAPLSPIYLNLRLIRSFPEVFRSTVEIYHTLCEGLHADCYADIPTAATPFVSGLALRNKVPMVTPRLDRKSHGSGGAIDGISRPGTTAILIDDLITTADSKLEAIDVLSAERVIVRDVVVLVDREQGGIAQLQDRGYKCHALVTLRGLIEYYWTTGKVQEADYHATMNYLRG